MAFYPNRQFTSLASSISVLAIAIGLIAGQSATQKSVAQSVGNGYGVGSTTVTPLFTAIKALAPNITYSPVGIGPGLKAFFTQTPPAGTPGPISFAVTDDPVLGTETVSGGRGSYVQVPVLGAGITLAYNASGLTVPAGGIKLSRASYCGILKGSITNWNNASISADNGGAIIANLPIKVVHRADTSGSTFILTTHLNTACKRGATPGIPAANVWNQAPGTTVTWPSSFIGATGGGGVATAIASTKGAIGYLDNATRTSKALPAAVLRNKAGNYTAPSTSAITEALLGGTLVKYGTNPNNRLIRIDNLNDPTRPLAYPISTATYFLFYDIYSDPGITTGIKSLITLALGAIGDSFVAPLGYAPLPASIKTVSTGVLNTCVNSVYGPSPCN